MPVYGNTAVSLFLSLKNNTAANPEIVLRDLAKELTTGNGMLAGMKLMDMSIHIYLM